MFPITQFLQKYWQNFLAKRVSFSIISYFCILLLYLFGSHQNSLMAHDEGLYAWRAKMMFTNGDWVHPWSTPHHKTPGPYWLIAIAYTVFGINEISVRLPSLGLGILSLVLVYKIGKILLNSDLASLATIILSLEFLWLQYCRLGTPDVPMVFLVLLAMFCLLKSESIPHKRHFYGFITGLALGLGFLVRSFMIVLPIVALIPYLITSQKQHRHLSNPYIYLGFLVGLIPTAIWIYLNIQHYGISSINQLWGFAVRLGSNERGGNGILFYVWNVPLKSFPWGLLAIAGGIISFRTAISAYNWLLLGFPIAVFVQLSLVSTRLSHYSLLLYPFIALNAAVALDGLRKTYLIAQRESQRSKSPRTRFLAFITYGMGILAIILLLAGMITVIIGTADIRKYATIAIAFGIGGCLLPIIWWMRDRFDNQQTAAQAWLFGLLIPFWLGLTATGLNGLISDYNPQVKQLITQPIIAQVLQRHPVNFVKVGGKTGVLLNFYTPRHGRNSDDISELPHNSYAWIPTKLVKTSTPPHRIIGGTKEYSLIQIQRPVVIGKTKEEQ